MLTRTRLNMFTAAYVHCALWSSITDDGCPMDEDYTVDDIDESTLQTMVDDCADFQARSAALIDGREHDAGRDFWLTRNGHGAGFWDGDWQEPEASQLTKLAKSYGERTLYIGDDGKVYQFPG